MTAIQAGGGNTDLIADATWQPLANTPSHPEYPAAHGCVTSVVADVIRDYSKTPKVHVTVDSLAFSDGVHTHAFEDTRALVDEVHRARIYAGFHYRHSMIDGATLGRRVARQLTQNHFRPRHRQNDADDDDQR